MRQRQRVHASTAAASCSPRCASSPSHWHLC